MGRRLRAVRVALRTVWALITALLLLLAILFTLVGIYARMGSSDATIKCRSAAAAQLDSARIARDDALADLQETIARLFDASIKRDDTQITQAAAKLAVLSDRIHQATAAVGVANAARLASIDACTKG